jgi:hypothetical protein
MPRFSSVKPSISWRAHGTLLHFYCTYVASHPCEFTGAAREGTENRFKDLTVTTEQKTEQANRPIN